MSLYSNEIAYLTKSEAEVLEETLEGKIDSKSLQDFSSFHDCSALSNCSNEVITHEPVPEQAGSYSDSSNGRRQLIDVPDAFTSRADGSEPIYEGEDREPMYEGEVVLAEPVDKRAGDAADSSKDEISPRQGDLIRNFLRNNASQLTVYGLFLLQDGLKEGELCVFFRNNHFSTMFKRDGELYILATDEGYLSQPDLVWEKFNKVNGDTLFMTGDFEEFKVESHAKTVQQPTFTGSSSTDIERIADDLLQEIIHRNLDVRDILMTFLVCQRFGRLVAKIRKVQVSLECFEREAKPFTANPQMHLRNVLEQTRPHQIEILVRPYVQSWIRRHACLPPLSNYLSVLRFVSTLAEIEELYIEVPSFMSEETIPWTWAAQLDDRGSDGTVPWKWAAQLDDGGLSNVIFLRAANCEDDDIQDTVKGVLRDATLVVDLLVQQAYHHKNLRRFTILDRSKRRENIEVEAPDLEFFKKGCYKRNYISNIKEISTLVPLENSLVVCVFLRYIYDGDEANNERTKQVTSSELEEMLYCLLQMVPEASFPVEDLLEYIKGHLRSEFVLPWTGSHLFD